LALTFVVNMVVSRDRDHTNDDLSLRQTAAQLHREAMWSVPASCHATEEADQFVDDDLCRLGFRPSPQEKSRTANRLPRGGHRR